MPKKIIADAGLLIGFLVQTDDHHDWAVEQFGKFKLFHTCEAVLAEACARLRYKNLDESAVLELVEAGVLRIDLDLQTLAGRGVRLMKKYSDFPMDFADACVVLMSETQRDCLVVTVDYEDFSSYRRFGRDLIPIATPQDR